MKSKRNRHPFPRREGDGTHCIHVGTGGEWTRTAPPRFLPTRPLRVIGRFPLLACQRFLRKRMQKNAYWRARVGKLYWHGQSGTWYLITEAQ